MILAIDIHEIIDFVNEQFKIGSTSESIDNLTNFFRSTLDGIISAKS